MNRFDDLKARTLDIARQANLPAEVLELIEGATDARQLQAGIAAAQAGLAVQDEAFAAAYEQMGETKMACQLRMRAAQGNAAWARALRQVGQ